MSAVRIENDAWTDWRFDALGQFAYPALARTDSRDMAMLRFFRVVSVCTDSQSYTVAVVACDAIGGEGFAAALVRCGLAEAVDAQTVRIKGTEGRIEWLREYREARQLGGKARAKAASRGPNGAFTSSRPAEVQQPASNPPAGAQVDTSSSQPYVLRTTATTTDPEETSPRIGIRDGREPPPDLELDPDPPPLRVKPADLEAVYQLYPRKEGKGAGLTKARKAIRTPADLDAFRLAVMYYAELMRREARLPKHMKAFDTFVGCWEDYTDPAVLTVEPRPASNGRPRGMSADEMYAKALELERQGR